MFIAVVAVVYGFEAGMIFAIRVSLYDISLVVNDAHDHILAILSTRRKGACRFLRYSKYRHHFDRIIVRCLVLTIIV